MINSIYFFILIVVGVFLVYPFHDFFGILSQGDIGREIYNIWATAKGQLPYKDYRFDYGPLLPFYYLPFYDIFGQNIHSMHLGRLFLWVFTGLFCYLGFSYLVSSFRAFLSSVFMIALPTQFFHTLNHEIGLMFVMALTWCVIGYAHTLKPFFRNLGLLFVFFISLVKLNFGLLFLFLTIATVFVIDQWIGGNKKWNKGFIGGVFICLLMIFAIYFYLLKGLSPFKLNQCLPFLPSGGAYTSDFSLRLIFKNLVSLFQLFKNNLHCWSEYLLVFVASVGLFVFRVRFLRSADVPKADKKLFLLVFLYLLAAFILSCHEYVIGNYWYASWWAHPVGLFLLLYLFWSIQIRGKFYIGILLSTLLIIHITVHYKSRYEAAEKFKYPKRTFRGIENENIYISNNYAWFDVIHGTMIRLKKELKEGDKFLMIPFDGLIYYLMNKEKPTWYNTFFKYNNITKEVELEVINDLKTNNVNFIVFSNQSHRGGIWGVFGKTHCSLLAKYIDDNYKLISTHGNFKLAGGGVTPFATRIYKKK